MAKPSHVYRVPEPHPDKDNEGHYMDVFRTPTDTLDGQLRPIDQFAPRANLKKLFGDNEISISNDKEIKDFAAKKQAKSFDDFNWTA